MRISVTIAVMIMLVLTAFTACSSPAGVAGDDIVTPPGGFTYRANVHQQGQRDWPPIQENEVTIETPSGTLGVRYRDYIETGAGETRNNIIYLDVNNSPELPDPLQVDYSDVGLPDGITIERDGEMYGGIGGQDRESSRVVLQIHIASYVKPGEYPFAVHIDYEGTDFGSFPCTVRVIE